MGLDNGIILKTDSPEKVIEKFNSRIVKLKLNFTDKDIEVCYWRKCWGIRKQIVTKFHFNQEGGEHKLEVEDIPAIIKILFSVFGEKEWEEADSIWDWEEFKDTLEQQINNLHWLYDYMNENPDVEVYFYDSY